MSQDPFQRIRDFSELREGLSVELVKTISVCDVEAFAKLTGDDNPLHLNEEYARQTQFRGTVSHGMLTAAFISTVIGTMLPGPGSLWLSQTLEFLEAVRPGDTIRIVAEVLRLSPSQNIADIGVKVYNQREVLVLTGKGRVKILKTKPMNTPTPISGKVALITGASRGIGAAIARQLAKQGLKIAVNYSSSPIQAEEVVREIREAGGVAEAFQADLGNESQIQAMFSQIEASLGPVAVLVNNAWPRLSQLPLADLSWDRFQNQLDVGVKGAFLCSKAAFPGMSQAGFGRIITISTIYADNVPPQNSADYVLAKTALASLAKSMALEWGLKGITSNIVSPGMTETDFLQGVPQKARLLAEVQNPLRRIANPEDIAGVVGFLASEAGNYVNGETIRVCGGQVML